MSEDSLFPGYEPTVRERRPSEAEGLSADRRRTLRQAELIADGLHPLTKFALHPLASRHRDAAASKDDPYTCGSCRFRALLSGPHDGRYPKCTEPGVGRASHSASSDIRAWWPACMEYVPGDRISLDAARYIP